MKKKAISIAKQIALLAALASVILVFVMGFRWNEYREKQLADVLDAGKIEEVLYINPSKEVAAFQFNEKLNDIQAIDELIGFFSRYGVKKTGEAAFSPEHPSEQFIFQLEYTDGRRTMHSMIEKETVLLGGEQYEILNGPVDYDWLQDFIAKYE